MPPKPSNGRTRPTRNKIIKSGKVRFAVEARLLRDLGERLVKQPEVALIELIKNAYDADADKCTISASSDKIVIIDSGIGMTFSEFERGWMRIGTASKAATKLTKKYGRPITGEKGIGRFAVRFLGARLTLRTVADDANRKMRTALQTTFDWANVDRAQDIGKVDIPYTLEETSADEPLGTTLTITDLRVDLDSIDWQIVRTGSIGLLSPLQPLLERANQSVSKHSPNRTDPGFSLIVGGGTDRSEDLGNVADQILERYALRAVVRVNGRKLTLEVFSNARNARTSKPPAPELSITDTYVGEVGTLAAEIRFYPKRRGAFSELPVDGRRALGWLAKNSGVAIYDRTFRVLPYGMPGDDWLKTARDTARRERKPKSPLALKHFPMSSAEAKSTELNYMLRLPHPQQLVGVVLVSGKRDSDEKSGLIPSADREGFVENDAFHELYEIVRGAVEAIAYIDRKIQKKEEDAKRRALVRQLRAETKAAIAEVRSNPRLRPSDKTRLIEQFTRAQDQIEEHETATKRREEQLEVLSLLGVVAGFMTHEFGVALASLEDSKNELLQVSRRDSSFRTSAAALDKHIKTLTDFADYSRAYIEASGNAPTARYPATPRVKQVTRIFGKYALERDIDIQIDIPRGVLAPDVPVALYNGVALNLYTNALKAVTARAGAGDRIISFRAWNEAGIHTLLVSDTGVGIPVTMRNRVFEPLITTTSSNADPLGSGLGLGLTLVRRAVESFKGSVRIVNPSPGFATSVEVRLPLPQE